MGQTPTGLPWPDGTAPVRDGDNAIRALAEALDPRAKYQVFAGSAGYTVNDQGGVSIPLPFQNIVTGVATTQASAYGYSWNRSPSAPAGYAWFQFTDVAAHAFVPNAFAIIDYWIVGY